MRTTKVDWARYELLIRVIPVAMLVIVIVLQLVDDALDISSFVVGIGCASFILAPGPRGRRKRADSSRGAAIPWTDLIQHLI